VAEVSSQASDARVVEEIAEILDERDIEAFVSGDWSTVAAWEIGCSKIGCSNLEVKHG
jgi:hypothetical protein